MLRGEHVLLDQVSLSVCMCMCVCLSVGTCVGIYVSVEEDTSLKHSVSHWAGTHNVGWMATLSQHWDEK